MSLQPILRPAWRGPAVARSPDPQGGSQDSGRSADGGSMGGRGRRGNLGCCVDTYFRQKRGQCSAVLCRLEVIERVTRQDVLCDGAVATQVQHRIHGPVGVCFYRGRDRIRPARVQEVGQR